MKYNLFCILKTVLFLFLLLFNSISTVDKSKFRTCDDTSFCRRQRYQDSDDREAKYSILKNSIQLNKANFTAKLSLVDKRYEQTGSTIPKDLLLEIDILTNNVIRMRINEQENNGIKARYDASHILDNTQNGLQECTDCSGFMLNQNKQSIVAQFGQNNEFRIDVVLNDFRLLLIDNIKNKVLIVVNSQNLLKFEHFRAKNILSNNEEDGNNTEINPSNSKFPIDIDGMWEESYDSFTDVKKYGPSSVGLDVTFADSKHVYGLPEHTTKFSLPNTRQVNSEGKMQYFEPLRLYNLDVFQYILDSPMALYGSIPVVISHGLSATAGMLWLNPSETFVDIEPVQIHYESTNELRSANNVVESKLTHWMSETGSIDLFLFSGANPDQVADKYTKLTGRPYLPPLQSIMYHQCRWNYNDQEDVADVDSKFDQYDIPYDTLWLDIEHTDGKRYFTQDNNHFSKPLEMQQLIKNKGRKMVTIIDPHIKSDDNYFVYKDALAQDMFVHNSEGQSYEGWCWPGKVKYLDFFDKRVLKYQIDLFKYDKYKNSSEILFTWNDMNEPSVFDGPEISMHKNCLHGDDKNWEHRDVHNLYGYLFQRATFLGLLERSGNKERPFVLSRAFFAGSQKWGAVQTGDNTAEQGHLEATTKMLLSHSVVGLTNIGADIGGFFGDPDPELLVRQYQIAAFHPFFRAHAHIDTKRREPQMFEEQYRLRIRSAIRTRYNLMPYIYTLFYWTSKNGQPVMKPLWWEFPLDTESFDIENEFLLGSDLLVYPVTKNGAKVAEIYFPGYDTEWINVNSLEKFKGQQVFNLMLSLDSIPVFQRLGSIIPKKLIARRSSTQMKNDPYTLYIALDKNGFASGTLYEDDGHSMNYQNGNYILRKFVFDSNTLKSLNLNSDAIFNYGNKHFSTTINRLVIYGLKNVSSIKRITACYVTNNQDCSTENRDDSQKKLEQVYDLKTDCLQVKKPEVYISRDFIILFLRD